jgi:diguanylate cyclase (GGDEF)-like protein/PAS domain S-box-containing protein
MPLSDPQKLADRAARRRQRSVVILVLSNAGVGLLLAFLVYSVLSASKASYTQQANDLAEGMAAIAQVSIASDLGQIDAVIRATGSELTRVLSNQPTDRAPVQGILTSNLKLLSGVEALRFSDDTGRVRWGNDLPPGAPPSVSDREYFKQALLHTSDDTLVTGPLRSRVSGNWVVVFIRPLRVDGQFKGILYVSVAASHFYELFERYDLTDQDAVTLRNSQLELIARRAPGSSVQGQVGSTTVSEQLKAAVLNQPSNGTFASTVAVDGVERITAYRKIEGWPYTVFAGISRDRFFKPWAAQAWTVSLLAALAWALVAAASIAVYTASLREGAAMQALVGQTRRVQALLRIAGDGIHIVNHAGMLVELSDSFAEMLRSSRARLLGRHISTWDANQNEAKVGAWLSKVKDGDKQRVDVQHRRDDGSVFDVELNMRVAEIDGQLFVFGSGRDVTEARQLVREQAAVLESDLVGMAKVEKRVIKWRNRAFERILGYGPGELEGTSTLALYENEDVFRQIGEELYPVIGAGKQYRTHVRMRHKHGEVLWIDLSATRLSDTETLLMAVDITAMKNAHEQMAHVAFHDALTGLPNRLLLADRLGRALSISKREGFLVAVCYLDLDGFKAVNDTLGHDAGDALLVEIARRLQANIRPSDTAARLGGDEFVLVLQFVPSDDWHRGLERVVEALAEPIVLPNGEVAKIGATFGVAISHDADLSSAEELLQRADRTMLTGKRTGKGGIYVD